MITYSEYYMYTKERRLTAENWENYAMAGSGGSSASSRAAQTAAGALLTLSGTGSRAASKSDGSVLALSHAWSGLGDSRRSLGDSSDAALPYMELGNYSPYLFASMWAQRDSTL